MRRKDIEIAGKHPGVSRDVARANTKIDIRDDLQARIRSRNRLVGQIF
jgi:hypothetical protein